jgi:hypothetical protein
MTEFQGLKHTIVFKTLLPHLHAKSTKYSTGYKNKHTTCENKLKNIKNINYAASIKTAYLKFPHAYQSVYS